MKHSLLLVCLLTSACGGGSVTLEGAMADSTATGQAWQWGSPNRVPIEKGRFVLEELQGDTLAIQIVLSSGDSAVMRLDGAGGGEIQMSGIWLEDGYAFPSSLSGSAPESVNGVRLTEEGGVPNDVNVQATVLAVSDDGDALIIRPAETGLPDLRVVVTPRSVVRTIDGDPVDPGGLAFGDSLRVSGVGQGNYLIASEIMVPRAIAASGGQREDDDDAGDDDEESNDRSDAAPARAGSAQSQASEPRVISASGAKNEDKVKNEQGKGRGNAKGRN